MIATVADYRSVTGESFPIDATVQANLARAQRKIEGMTGRLFDQVERTEALAAADGAVWPKAYPIVSVSLPTTATVSGDALSILTGTTSGLDVLYEVAGLNPDRLPVAYQLVTYVGGYATSADAPVELIDAICELAQRYSQPANTAAVPAGTNSVSVGNQSYSGGTLGGASKIPPALKADILRFRHIRARMAD